MANSMLEQIRLEQRRKQMEETEAADVAVTDEGEIGGNQGEDPAVEDENPTDESVQEGRRLPDVPDKAIDEGDVDVTVEMQPGGAVTSRSATASKEKPDVRPPARVKRKSKRNVTYIRDLPTSLVTEARRLFPSANNNTDAVAAYMAFKSGVMDDLTDEQMALVKSYDGEDPVVSMNERIHNIERSMVSFMAMFQELELTLGFIAYDRLGYRRESADSPRDVNMLENGVDAMVERMRESAKQFRARDAIKNGRPIR